MQFQRNHQYFYFLRCSQRSHMSLNIPLNYKCAVESMRIGYITLVSKFAKLRMKEAAIKWWTLPVPSWILSSPLSKGSRGKAPGRHLISSKTTQLWPHSCLTAIIGKKAQDHENNCRQALQPPGSKHCNVLKWSLIFTNSAPALDLPLSLHCP